MLRRGRARHGITLLDVMVFDQEFHWWSDEATVAMIADEPW